MYNLIIMHDQTGATGKDIIPLPDGITATDALMNHFPQGLNPEAVQVYIGLARMILPNESDTPSPELLQPLTQNIIVVMEVKALGVIAGINAWVYIGGVAVIAAIAYLTPKIPGDVGQRKDSPNNNLQGQTNIARPYQAYPLVFGSPVSYPDLTGEPVVEYIDNQKIVRQQKVVCVGTADIIKTLAGATPINNFPGASATYYEPINRVVTVPEVISVFATNEVDGQELLGSGNSIVIATYELTEHGSSATSFVGTTFIFQVALNTESTSLFTDFNAAATLFKLKVNYRGDFSGGASGDTDRDGAGYISTMVANGGGTFYTVTLTSFNGDKTVDDSYEFSTPFVTEQAASSIIGPIKIAVETDEVWINLNFLRGLKATVMLRVLFTQLDGPNGNPIVGPSPDSYDLTFVDTTLDPQFRTHKQTLIQGFNYYQVSIQRLDNGTNNTNRPDQTTLEAVYAVSRETNVDYGDLTILDVTIPATVRATSLRQNKINVELISKLITYENGAINYTPRASRKMADAVLHLTVDFHQLDPNTLALDELYEIQDRLDLIDPRLATFDFTFDDMDVSYNDQLTAILQVARCYTWKDGDVYRFGRNEERTNESTAITRRDIVNDDDREYSITYNPQLLENFDSVKVEYVSKSTNKKAYIFRKLNNAGVIINGAGVNPKSIQLAGCSEEYNAINRAELEIRTLMYQRYSMTETVGTAGMFLDRGDMILYSELYNVNVFNGEILGLSGSTATVSESMELIVGNDYFVHYTTPDGSSVGPFAITSASEFTFECASLGQAYVRDSILGYSTQKGSTYIISTTAELGAAQWTITEKEARGRNVQLSMVNYDQRIYDFD